MKLSFFLILVGTTLISSCRSNKHIVVDEIQQKDSIAYSESYRSITSIDSLIRNIDFKFDTLKINFHRHVEFADEPEVISLTAINGEIVDNRQLRRNKIEVENNLDTVAFKQVSSKTSSEHSATTRMYNPPNGTAVFIALFVVVAILIFLFLRNKK